MLFQSYTSTNEGFFLITCYQLLLIASEWNGQANPPAENNYGMCALEKKKYLNTLENV